VARLVPSRTQRLPVAGGARPDLRPSEKCYRRRKLVRVTHAMRLGTEPALKVARPRTWPLRTAEYRFYRAREFDRPPWGGSPCSSHLGHFSAVPTPLGPSGVVARLLSFCAPSRIAAGEARAATRTRGQTIGATLPATYAGDGSGENHPTMDGAFGALLPLAKGFRLRGTEARGGCSAMLRGD
jgi:hypothetical protein